MRMHPREEIVRKARIDFLETWTAWMRRHPDLTYLERSQMLAETLQTEMKYALRVERHGDDQAPAGLE